MQPVLTDEDVVQIYSVHAERRRFLEVAEFRGGWTQSTETNTKHVRITCHAKKMLHTEY